MSLSIITSWLNKPELISKYSKAVTSLDSEIIIVSNQPEQQTHPDLIQMVKDLNGKIIFNDVNRYFSAANNQGLKAATGDVILFLSGGIMAENGDWLTQVEEDVKSSSDCGLYGPSLQSRSVGNRNLSYLENWCIAGSKETWDILGGWDEKRFPYPYWEDNALSFKACQKGMFLNRTTWPVNYSSSSAQPFDSYSRRNQQVFEDSVAAWCLNAPLTVQIRYLPEDPV